MMTPEQKIELADNMLMEIQVLRDILINQDAKMKRMHTVDDVYAAWIASGMSMEDWSRFLRFLMPSE